MEDGNYKTKVFCKKPLTEKPNQMSSLTQQEVKKHDHVSIVLQM